MPYASMKYMDTADDYLTAWFFRGHDELGVAPMIDEKVNWEATGVPVKKVLVGLSGKEKQMIREELQENPRFKMLVDAARQTKNPRKALKLSAQRALVNEMDPKQYPESQGTWTKLRKKLRKGRAALPGIIQKELGKLKTLEQKTAYLKAMVASKEGAKKVNLADFDEALGGMGFYDLIGSLASTAAGIYGSKLTADAQKDIAKIQAGAAMASVKAQTAIAEAQQAIAAARVAQAKEQKEAALVAREIEAEKTAQKKVAGVITAEVGGIPMWAIILALAALGIGAFVFFK